MLTLNFETHPSKYKHIKLTVDGPIARLALAVQEDGGERTDYALKLNSYDITVDIELWDAVNRLRFEQPQVGAVILTSGLSGCFCAGANIFMLRSSTHAFKVNFCKFTNETRLGIEDATANDGQIYIAALNGIASGGGYELALACEEIILVDDRKSAVSLPEVPYLGVLPGTGGLTRVTDKRKVRRDRADVFSTLAEGVKGKRAVEWGLVDSAVRLSQFDTEVQARAETLAAGGHPERRGVELGALDPEVRETEKGSELVYRHVRLEIDTEARSARLVVRGPEEVSELPEDPTTLGADWYPLRAFRELDDALLRLRFHYRQIGVVTVHSEGDLGRVLALDAQLASRKDHWFVAAVVHHIKRVLKRLDMTSRSLFALLEEGSCFGGTFLEIALACDRQYIFDEDGVELATSSMNGGAYPMGNGLTRLETRFLAHPDRPKQLVEASARYDAQAANEVGLVTEAFDELDWDDEIRLIVEERRSLSPDALTAMEANLRFAGPETLETKIFGRLTAWQNWIFQRPNAVGEQGALTLYGQPETPHFDWERT